tara:strand:+ start:1841 stop:2140 length:300 start_codon:yes stop_codon:yes gene_type:complete
MNKYIEAPLILCDYNNAINYYIGYTLFFLLSGCSWFIIFHFDVSGTKSNVVNFVFSAFFTFLYALSTRFICLYNYKSDQLLCDSDDDDRINYYDIDLRN